MDAFDNPSDAIRKLGELIDDIPVAMLTTVAADGAVHSRPMATQQAPFDGALWFFSEAHTAKTDEILDNQHVNVNYADPERNRYISLSGVARLVRDPAKARELWTPMHQAWFPEGSEDPNLVLVRVDVESAEYWNAPDSRMVRLRGLLRSVAGQGTEPGEGRRIELHRPRGEAGTRGEPSVEDWPKGERPPGKSSNPAPPPYRERPSL